MQCGVGTSVTGGTGGEMERRVASAKTVSMCGGRHGDGNGRRLRG